MAFISTLAQRQQIVSILHRATSRQNDLMQEGKEDKDDTRQHLMQKRQQKP